ncbi:MAG: hypothetical protein A2413_01280 [Treponema sp. RIFOXYC1_FULL_61_9]|nr:MAG: hypothetical protein A2413_01280 [Treponema sp. RIFOXYC1_FULL_61_9]
MKIDDFLRLEWSAPGSPLIEPPRFSPVIADPSFLFPEESPDGNWALVAHSAWGLHRYSSADGQRWLDRGLIVRHVMRPFLRRAGGEYFLFYEAYAPFALPLTVLPFRRPWRSSVRLTRSADLVRWSRPETALGPDLDWMTEPGLGSSVSNPCLIEDDSGWRLYFSASLSWIPDCGFSEPRFIGAAGAPEPGGPFVPYPRPILDPATDPRPGVLGAGSLKAVRMDDGWIGLQNKIYRDAEGRSRSALFALRSADGLSWTEALHEPLLSPGPGWTASHVYACDLRYRESDGLWYLYFNARGGWRIPEGKERIGRIIGRSAARSAARTTGWATGWATGRSAQAEGGTA